MNPERYNGKDGGPAFAHGNPEQGGHPGMTLRDYFAAQAVNGLALHHRGTGTGSWVAEQAYAIADAMLKAREES